MTKMSHEADDSQNSRFNVSGYNTRFSLLHPRVRYVSSKMGQNYTVMACDREGVLYHAKCWNSQPLHRNQSHRAIPIRDVERLRYINGT